MAAVFNVTDCFTGASNTGLADCVTNPGMLKFEIALPRGTRISVADAQPDTFFDTLVALLTDDTPGQRGYIIGPYTSVEDSTGEATTESYDHGGFTTLADPAYTWTRRIIAGALCAHTGLRKFSQKQDKYDWLLLFVSTNKEYSFHVMGTQKTNTATGALELAGVRYNDLYAKPWKIATGTTTPGYFLQSNMTDVRQINEKRIVVNVTWDAEDLPRVKDVNVTLTKASTGNFDVEALDGCSGVSLTELYPLLVDDAAWMVENDAGTSVPMTGVTEVGGKFRLALNTSDAAYTAGTHFRAKLQPISVTSASPFNVEYVESEWTALVAK